MKVHIEEQPRTFGRFHKSWTPTLAVLDHRGIERHAFVGYLPADEFLAQLSLGLGQIAFGAGEWERAEDRFRATVSSWPEAEAAPGALYWAGVARYKDTQDGADLAAIAGEAGVEPVDSGIIRVVQRNAGSDVTATRERSRP